MIPRCAFCGALLDGERCGECGCDRFFIARVGTTGARALAVDRALALDGRPWLIA